MLSTFSLTRFARRRKESEFVSSIMKTRQAVRRHVLSLGKLRDVHAVEAVCRCRVGG